MHSYLCTHGVKPWGCYVPRLVGKRVIQKGIEGKKIDIMHGDVIVLRLGLKRREHR